MKRTSALLPLTVLLAGALAPASASAIPAAPAAPVGAGFSYQGQLRKDGRPHTGACDFQFSLWDDAAGGVQQGSTQSVAGVVVSGGLFTVGLNDAGEFGASPFTGEARWLEVAVQCADDAGFTTLSPRTGVATAPYALGLRPGAIISGTGLLGLQVNTPNGNAIVGYSRTDAYASIFGGDSSPGGGFGVVGLSSAGTGVYGQGGRFKPSVTGFQIYTDSVGVWGEANNTGAVGVYGKSISNTGVYGVSSTGNGMWAQSATGTALRVDSSFGTGVYVDAGATGLYVDSVQDGIYVNSASVDGLRVWNAGWNGVYVASAGRDGVYVNSAGASYAGVVGQNTNANSLGVKGVANAAGSVGVWGESTANTGVYGLTTTGNGVWGASAGSGRAGYFQGNVQVTGNMSKGGGSFKIDHPLDPANKYLYHSFVESPDMMNIYNGNTTTDAKGFAEIELPEWFEALNKDFRYQLTVVGQFAQAIVAKEIERNRFVIQTDKPKVKVSWQVTGIRRDAYANAHRIPVEEDKPEGERGRYLHPDAFGQPTSMGVDGRQPAASATR